MHMYMEWIYTYMWNRIEIKLKINLEKPWHILMWKKRVKIPFSSLYVGSLLLRMQLILKFILFPRWSHWKKLNSLLPELICWGQLLLGMEECVYFSFELLDPIWYTPMQALCMMPQSVWVYKHIASFDLENLFSWCSPSPLTLHSLCLFFYRVSRIMKRDILWDIPFKDNFPRSLFLWVLFVLVSEGGSFSWWRLNKAPIYE